MPDSKKESLTNEWFRKSREDLDSAKCLLGSTPPHPETACFLIQQGVEKALKGYLCSKEIGFKKTHDLAKLGEPIAQREPDIQELLKQATKLQEFAVEIRYPGEDDPPTAKEANGHLDLGNKIYEGIQKKVTRG